MLSSTIYTLLFLLAATHAIPLRRTLEERDVISPPITSPDASTVWNVGDTVTVTWNLSALPPNTNVTGVKGMVVLGYSTWQNENLDIDDPLAQNFLLSDGKVSFVVPSVPTRNNYIVDLFGDSGNISPNFTIIGTSDSSSAATSTSVVATTAESTSVVVTTEVSTAVTTVPPESTSASSVSTPSSVPSVAPSISSPTSSASVPSVLTVSVSTASSAPKSSASMVTGASEDNGNTSGAMSFMATSFFGQSLAAVIATLSIVML